MPRSGVLNVSFAEKPPDLRGAGSGRKALQQLTSPRLACCSCWRRCKGQAKLVHVSAPPRDLAEEGPARAHRRGNRGICTTLPPYMVTAKSGCYTKEHSYPVGQDVTADRPHDQDRKGPVPAQNKQGHGKFLRVEPQKADKGGGTAGNDRKN